MDSDHNKVFSETTDGAAKKDISVLQNAFKVSDIAELDSPSSDESTSIAPVDKPARKEPLQGRKTKKEVLSARNVDIAEVISIPTSTTTTCCLSACYRNVPAFRC